MIVLTFAFCFFMIEYVIGQFYYSNVNQLSYAKFDASIGWCLTPGNYWRKPPQSFRKHSIYINKSGLRNKDLATRKPGGLIRIIILGDSFTFGEINPEEHLFSYQLEEFLYKNHSIKCETINAGVPGYGTAQEMLLMKRLSKNNVVGDIYLLMIFTNDILDILRLDYGFLDANLLQPGFAINEMGKIELKYPPENRLDENLENFMLRRNVGRRAKIVEILKRRLESWIQTKSSLVKTLNKLGFQVSFPRMPGLINGWYRRGVLDAGVPLMKAIMKEIKKQADTKSAKLLVSLIPSPIQVYPDVYGDLLNKTFPGNKLVDEYLKDPLRPQTIITNMCWDLQIPFLDLYPVLYEKNDKVLYIPREGHFSKSGHTIVAEELAKMVAKNLEK